MLSKAKWDRILALTTEIHAMGCAVVVFTPDDVQGFDEDDEDKTEISDEDALDFMREVSRQIEDRMCEAGNTLLYDLVTDRFG